ncbi:MAG TPA: sulfite exporter TauE/SafE family protein [Ktedonobacteraceae bacterium]|nr:sulfite exporter TauE/SafE family protein [Ktedonobacteraceae bacterium]
MLFLQLGLLFLVAALAGTLNAVAGGGSFFTVPTLIFTGMPYVLANTTSTVALWPGSVASAGAYRNEIVSQNRNVLILLIGSSLIGGILGAILLIKTSQSTFVLLLPYLLLFATLLFAFSERITEWLRRGRTSKTLHISVKVAIGIALAQFIIAIYGGYFGGGIGILMLAGFSIIGMENIHAMNGLKTILASCINGVAVITFIITNEVMWPQALVMILGGTLGGYLGAYYARKIDQKWIRLFVIVVGFSLTLYFFLHS